MTDLVSDGPAEGPGDALNRGTQSRERLSFSSGKAERHDLDRSGLMRVPLADKSSSGVEPECGDMTKIGAA